MDINNLKAFIEVADKKSFSRSAESLKLTQPAVSKRVAALETELSAKLFDRVGRSVLLTEAGRVLLPSARQITSELSRIEDVICNLGKDVGGVLTIGTTEHIATHRLPSIFKSFREEYPQVEIDLQFAGSDELINAVEQGIVEIALCTASAKPAAKLREIKIWHNDMVVVVSSDHPLTKEDTVPLDTLAKCPAILPVRSMSKRGSIENVLQQNGIKPIVSMEATDFETMRSMASIGLGWACIPNYLVDDSLFVIDIDEIDLSFSVSLIKHRERTLSRAAQAFLDCLPGAPEKPEKPH